MAPPRSDAKKSVLPSVDSDGENSARSELIPVGSRCGTLHWATGPARVVIQISESWLSKPVDRLKYNVVPSALGVGNASNASVLSRGPRFTAGPHECCLDARVATYISAFPKPALRVDGHLEAVAGLATFERLLQRRNDAAAALQVQQRCMALGTCEGVAAVVRQGEMYGGDTAIGDFHGTSLVAREAAIMRPET